MSDEFKETTPVENPDEATSRTDSIRQVSAIQGLSPEAQQSMKQAHQTNDFLHDIQNFRDNPETIKNFSKEARDNYFVSRTQKVEAEADSYAKPALEELRQKYADRPEVFEALDQALAGQDFKKLEFWESCSEAPSLVTNDRLSAIYKYHDGYSSSLFYTPEYLIAPRDRQERLALPTKGVFGDQYLLEPGARYLKSSVAPKFNHPGGGEQWFVIDKDKVIKPNE